MLQGLEKEYSSRRSLIETFSGAPEEGMFQKQTKSEAGDEEIAKILTFKRRGWAEFLTLVKHWVGSKLGLVMEETYVHDGTRKIFNKHARGKKNLQIEIMQDAAPDNPDVQVIIPPTDAMLIYTEREIDEWIKRVSSQRPGSKRRKGDTDVIMSLFENMTYASHPNPYLVNQCSRDENIYSQP